MDQTTRQGDAIERSAEDLLRHWAAGKLDVPVEEVLSVTFRHEDGYGNDSGTYWPEENYAIVSLSNVARGKSSRPRRHELSIDGIEGLTGFIREVLEANAS